MPILCKEATQIVGLDSVYPSRRRGRNRQANKGPCVGWGPKYALARPLVKASHTAYLVRLHRRSFRIGGDSIMIKKTDRRTL